MSETKMYAVDAAAVKRLATRATRATCRAIDLEVLLGTVEYMAKIGGSTEAIAEIIATTRPTLTPLDGDGK